MTPEYVASAVPHVAVETTVDTAVKVGTNGTTRTTDTTRTVAPLPLEGMAEKQVVVATSATLPAATVTFTPPEGSGLEATTWDDLPGGNGARAFTFNARGVWTVTLTFADNTTRTAQIDIQTAGFVLIVK